MVYKYKPNYNTPNQTLAHILVGSSTNAPNISAPPSPTVDDVVIPGMQDLNEEEFVYIS